MYTNGCCNQMSHRQICPAYDGCSGRSPCDGVVQTNIGGNECCIDMFPIPNPAKLVTPYKKKKKLSKIKSSGSNRSIYSHTYPEIKSVEKHDAAANSISCNCSASLITQVKPQCSQISNNHKHQKNPHPVKKHMEVIDEESETEIDKAEEDRKRSVQESCADFLSIVHDNVVETVQKSVDCILRDYFVHTMEKMETLCSQMLRNECMLSKMYLDIIDKITQQDEKNLRQFKCICQFLAETRIIHEAQTKSLAEMDCGQVLFRASKNCRSSNDANSANPIISSTLPKTSLSCVNDIFRRNKNDQQSYNNTISIRDNLSEQKERTYLTTNVHKGYTSIKTGPSNSDIPSTSQRSKSCLS